MAFLLHRLPPALVTLAGDQEASAALVTRASLAPRATEGMGVPASRLPGLGLLQVLGPPGRWQPFCAGSGHCGGQRGCFCHAWKGADGGEETQHFRQRGLQWWSGSSTQVLAFIPALSGVCGQLRGTVGTFSAPVCRWHSPGCEATWKRGAQSRFNQLMVSGCAHTSACASRSLLPLFLITILSD